MSDKNHDRAVRYRRLALAEPDKAKAALLQKIATKPSEECCARSTRNSLSLKSSAASWIQISASLVGQIWSHTPRRPGAGTASPKETAPARGAS